MSNLIGLVDCNNFFVSCERLFDPSLEGIPVGVLSSNDGCVVARSGELKALGVSMGEPYFKFKKEIEAAGGVVKSSNFRLYGAISKRLVALLDKELGSVQRYSVDEAFIYFNHSNPEQALEQAKRLKLKIQKWLGVPVSIGIARSKTLAKAACYMAKKSPALEGICALGSPVQEDYILGNMPVGEVWGVGRRRVVFLKSVGIHTARDLKYADTQWVKKRLSITGWRMQHELRGNDCIELEPDEVANKTILRSGSFRERVSIIEDLQAALSSHVTCASEVLRKQRQVCHCITIFLRTSAHGVAGGYRGMQSIKLEEGTCLAPVILKVAEQLLDEIYYKGLSYKKIGVILSDIHDSEGSQRALYGQPPKDEAKQEALMETFELVRKRFGKHSLCLATTTLGSGKWKRRSNTASKDFLGSFDQLRCVRS